MQLVSKTKLAKEVDINDIDKAMMDSQKERKKKEFTWILASLSFVLRANSSLQ